METTTNGNSPTSIIATPRVPAMPDKGVCTQGICHFTAILGKEVFSPMHFPRGMRCKLILSGVCYLASRPSPSTISPPFISRGIDVFYEEDKFGNYVVAHDYLRIDRNLPHGEVLEADRFLHTYTLSYLSHGGRLAFLLQVPTEYGDYFLHDKEPRGGIEVTVAALTAAELAEVGFGSKRQQREHERAEKLHNDALFFAVRAHAESDFLDEKFRHDYATKNLAKILSTEKQAWLELYQYVCTDTALHSLLVADHPHVLPYLEALLDTARIAGRLALSHDPESTQQARIASQQKGEIEQYRADADTKLSKLMERIKTLERLRKSAKELGLDQGRIEDLVEELELALRITKLPEHEETNRGYKQF